MYPFTPFWSDYFMAGVSMTWKILSSLVVLSHLNTIGFLKGNASVFSGER
jgi:hypothetical protein